MAQRLDHLKETASQTAGPYVHIGTNPNWVEITGVWGGDLGLVLVGPETRGERILVTGRIFDGLGKPLNDALVEIWQADAEGLYNSPEEKRGKSDPHFVGWGRQPTHRETGEFRFETIKPGALPYIDGRPMAPHITVYIVARGINIGLQTRMYFGDEVEANAGLSCLAPHRTSGPGRDTGGAAKPGERAAGLYVRHPSPGPPRDGLLRCVMGESPSGRQDTRIPRGQRPHTPFFGRGYDASRPSPRAGKVARPQAESDGAEPWPEDPTRRFAPPAPSRGGTSRRPAPLQHRPRRCVPTLAPSWGEVGSEGRAATSERPRRTEGLVTLPPLLSALVGDPETEAQFTDAADLAAMLRVESALAEAEAATGADPGRARGPDRPGL